MNEKQRELEILRDLSSKLSHPEQKTWLFPLYPKSYQFFSRKRNSKWCIGEHSLYIDEYEDEASDVFTKDREEIQKYLDNTPCHQASMQLHDVVLVGEDEVRFEMQTYGSNSDCDHIYPAFKYYDNIGLWVCCDEEYAEPMVLRFNL